jgi:hypothetical protein
MQHLLDRISERRFPGARLVTEVYHNRSFGLYAKLGFEVREPLAVRPGPPIAKEIHGFSCRATEDDLDPSNQLTRKVHSHDRGGKLLDAIKERSATVVEHDGRISGYATLIAFFGHAVGETNEDLNALIGSAWHYGWAPKTCSSLILKVPEEEVTLILLANSDAQVPPSGLGVAKSSGCQLQLRFSSCLLI